MQEKEIIPYGELRFENLTNANWPLFENLMGEKGGCGGCWCMSFRLPSATFKQNKYDGNKKLFKQLVCAGKPTGLLAIYHNEAIGWVALSPREDLLKIENSRSLKRIDDKPVWSVSCFFVKKEYRHRGLSRLLLQGVVEYARQQNISTLEAYPAIPYASKVPAPFLWTGILSAFTGNGFTIVQKNGNSKAMVRMEVGCAMSMSDNRRSKK